MRLPQLPYTIRQSQSEIVSIRGINYSSNFKEGCLSETKNISTKDFPYFSARRKRKLITEYAQATAISCWDKLVVVQNGRLFYNGEDVGKVENGPKQFAVVNTKIVIWPDKVYYDTEKKEIKPLGAKISGKKATFSTNKITVTWDVDFTKLFEEGDGITISGCTVNKDNNKDIVVKKVEAKTLVFDDNTLNSASETEEITVERKIPELDFICESENRLWGCSNKERSIYASALGDPKNFHIYKGLSTDSYTLAIGSEGDFTGCCKLSSSVLFWKNNMLHKILGGFPSEYSLYSYNIEGVLSGCYKSMQVINETLFYLSAHGVYAYSGGNTMLVSDVFGENQYIDGVAGNDGNNYYLSARNGDDWHLFTYSIKNGIWLREDSTKVIDFARMGKDIYFLDSNGKIYLEDSGQEDNDIEWSMTFTPFYETVEGKKRLMRLIVRTEMPQNSWIKAEIRTDGGLWMDVKRISGVDDGLNLLPIPVNRCDKFEIRLSGKGPFKIKNILKVFNVGGVL